MSIPTEIKALHQHLSDELDQQFEAEQALELAQSQAETALDEQQGFCQIGSLDAAGINTKALGKLEQELNMAADEDFADVDEMMRQASMSDTQELDLDSGLVPEGSMVITPSAVELVSEEQEPSADAQLTIGGGRAKGAWNWARGAGGGCIGGRASNTQIVKWSFWFKPTQNRFYSIKPRFVFNGYYIAQANDKWFNCKNAQVRISAMTNVYQFNWKGWRSEDLININRSNVRQNRRLDDSRYTNYPALLGRNDWVKVVCYVKLYVRAQGGGSYAKTDFSTGSNRLMVPYIVVN